MKLKQAPKLHQILRYICILFVIVFGFISIIGTGGGGGGGGSSNGGEPQDSLSGTWNGSVKEYLSDSQGQLTIVITSDTDVYDIGAHDIAGTVTLTGFPLCFTQGLFSSETGTGYWHESTYIGTIIAIGENFSRAVLYFDVSSDLKEILIHYGSSGFEDSNGDYCLFPDNAVLTKQE